MGTIGGLYNALHQYHSKLSKSSESGAYPIHKRFNNNPNSKTADFQDINDWLVSTLDFSKINKILDVGCGVGASSIALAKVCDCEVKGITLSEKELETAISFVKKTGVKNCTFSLGDMSDPIEEKYDVMIAVESIKHVQSLKLALINLEKSLEKGGVMVIVEDFLSAEITQLKNVEKFKRFWMVNELYSVKDYDQILKSLGLVQKNMIDFSDRVRNPNYWFLTFKFLLLNFIHDVLPIRSLKSTLSIFLGGFILDSYYKKGQMEYKVLVYVKE